MADGTAPIHSGHSMIIGPFARMPEPDDPDFKLMERRIVEFLVPVW